MTLLLLFVLAKDAPPPLSAGGPLSPWQAVYDVRDVRLALTVDPAAETIDGFAELTLQLTSPEATLLALDLHRDLIVERVWLEDQPMPFRREGHLLWLEPPAGAGPWLRVRIDYGGKPLTAERPPWEGGFNWSRTAAGAPWVGVSCQGEGGSVWFPCKTHPSDKIEGLTLEITVPEPLVCAANGLLQGVRGAGDGWRTFIWRSDQPIADYNVSINIAPYDVHELAYPGEPSFPMSFYFLKDPQPDDMPEGDPRGYAQKRQDLICQAIDYLDFYIRRLGPFPFEKFGVAHTDYLGMEHQTINSYGAHFDIEEGYDFLLLHEMGHEWWGNKVSVADWADFWIHEGVCTYLNGVYVAEALGEAAGRAFFQNIRRQIQNEQAVIPGRQWDAQSVSTLDVYYKGAWMLRGLAWLVGQASVDRVLRRLATDPAHTYANQVDTAVFIAMAEAEADRELDWFFETYLHRAKLPVLTARRGAESLSLAWHWAAFQMPVELEVEDSAGPRRLRLPMTGGLGSVKLEKDASYRIDPDGWLLMTVIETP